MSRGRRLGLLAVVVAAAAGGYLYWQRAGDAGPSVTERARQPAKLKPDSLSAQAIPQDDLPPPGTRSLFDHLMAQSDGVVWPFEKLVAVLTRFDPEGKVPVMLMIPQGRSLLKARADDVHPRMLVAMDFQAANTPAQLGLAPRGQLFLGFVEKASEIEVLSYNEAAGRFEFQLVQNYCESCVPRLVYARRAVCTSCHQGGGPIFPQRPWNETNGQPETAGAIAAARVAAGLDGASYLQAPTANPLSVPERFDELTDVGNFVPVTQRIWIDGCGGSNTGTACRLLTLKLALRYLADPGDFDPQSAEATQLRELQAADWPEDGIEVPGNDLPNRDPLSERRGWRGALRGLFARKPEPGAGAKDNEDLEAFDRLPRLPRALDPLTPRAPKRVLGAQDLDGVYGIAQFFTAADVKALEARALFDPVRLEARLKSLPADFFEPKPFSRVRAMQALLGYASSANYCCLDTAEMSPPVASGEPPVAIAEGSVLVHFEQYCFACHRGNPSRRLDFMSGRTEAEVLARIRETPAIRDALDWSRYAGTDKESKLMPPADSAQRRRLEAALAADPKLLEEMSAAVPGMFDF